ncbi:MBL fold metallo-hydrolase [Lentisphaerota bacterium ZTH]|nr:MBL fold metallo-hydrolase [Lentisphaerota bacterium]WET06065.1 MBL fold metallo-hydrolase [Lentisphaerota bacterium ZTH]
MNVTVLVDNNAGRDGLHGESGLSVLIEKNNKKILFDTGLGSLFYKNAEVLGIDLSEVDYIILSHGHYDHSDGLSNALNKCSNANLVLHRDALKYKMSDARGNLRYVGIDSNSLQAISDANKHNRVIWCDDAPFLLDGRDRVFSSGGREILPSDWSFFIKEDDQNYIQDNLVDEVSLLMEGEKSNFLIVGCSHCGLSQIVNTAESLSTKPVGYILGGSHLNDASDEEIKQTVDFLKKRPDCKLYLGHCTGMLGFAKLYNALSDKNIFPINTGWNKTFQI